MNPNVMNVAIKVQMRQVMTCFVLGLLLSAFYGLSAAGTFLLGVTTVVVPNFVLMFLFFGGGGSGLVSICSFHCILES